MWQMCHRTLRPDNSQAKELSGVELLMPEQVLEACRLLAQHQHQALVVGGGIRDLILGVHPSDWDLATDADPHQVSKIFTVAGYRVLPTGLPFGTVTVLLAGLSVEVTTFRVEKDYRDFRRPSQVLFVKKIEDDLGRRDFTFNALAYDPLQGQIHDPFGGLQDLCREKIRAVGNAEERISEDPLRMLRAVRFAAEYGFSVEPETLHALSGNAHLIKKVSVERIRDELNRILITPHFINGLELLRDSGLLFHIIPEMSASWLFWQYHPSHRYTVLTHTVEAMRYTTPNLVVRLAVLLHDVGKPTCFSRDVDGRGHFYGHNTLGAEISGAILRRLHYSARLINRVSILIREHMLDLGVGPEGMRRMISRVGRETAPDLLEVRRADILAHSTPQAMQSLEDFEQFQQGLGKLLAEESSFDIRDLAVDGDDVRVVLNCQPGPLIGQVLHRLWEEVISEPQKNNRSYLMRRIVEIAGSLCHTKKFQ
jgi:tRNA nucleotidyltransferase (CCA-adding enzyme)